MRNTRNRSASARPGVLRGARALVFAPLALLSAGTLGCVGQVGTGGDAVTSGGETRTGGRAAATGSAAPRGGAGGAAGRGGTAGMGALDSGPVSGPAFACNATTPPKTDRLRRLTNVQYRNTLRDLLAATLGDANQAGSVLGGSGVSISLDRMPRDERERVPEDLHGSYRRLDQDLQQVHVDGAYDVAAAIGAALTSTSRLGTTVGKCATDADPSNDDPCITGFVQRFGERALRRPLTAEEVTFYRGFYGNGTAIVPAAFADVIAGFLSSPKFLYLVEHGDAAVPGKPDVYTLSAWELASRLSYQFWQTMPDKDLFDAARSGTLKTPEGWRAQVDRVFADPRTRATLDEFFFDYLKLEELKPLDVLSFDAVWKAFAGGDSPSGALHKSMADDAMGLLRHFTFDAPGSLDDVFTTDLSFAKTADLAKIYGVAPWTPGTPPPRIADGTRPGLLTRAAFLVTGTANTRPIMKGVFIRTNILCDEIPPPPNNANAVPPPLDPKLSTRQVVETLTQDPATGCAGCHINLINPLGFATENFDALGRLRTEQRLFDGKGKEIGKAPIDTRAVPRVALDDPTPVNGPADLMRLIVSSGKAHACFARHYFRFTHQRWEDLAADGCTLERLRRTLVEKGSMQAMFKEIALDPAFQQRSFR